MSDNRKTFRLSDESQRILDAYRETNKKGPSWDPKMITENEAINRMIESITAKETEIENLKNEVIKFRRNSNLLVEEIEKHRANAKVLKSMFVPDPVPAPDYNQLIESMMPEVQRRMEYLIRKSTAKSKPAPAAPAGTGAKKDSKKQDPEEPGQTTLTAGYERTVKILTSIMEFRNLMYKSGLVFNENEQIWITYDLADQNVGYTWKDDFIKKERWSKVLRDQILFIDFPFQKNGEGQIIEKRLQFIDGLPDVPKL